MQRNSFRGASGHPYNIGLRSFKNQLNMCRISALNPWIVKESKARKLKRKVIKLYNTGRWAKKLELNLRKSYNNRASLSMMRDVKNMSRKRFYLVLVIIMNFLP
jgi:hypothetical protein